ncbi:diacylglycerol/lipid kinase family protein [Cellulomonas marina]|uniref:Diacylglycerol kinase family enzyme n=1 Tax=Cellulomonas marina TaxID=988821 RepID=A0A1I0Y0N8_9CELL|nr:diacylglycerol kinase family protein [Cellulomonas marina]GIG28446.1 sphingosine kinase [Cellulomonas marina]SFB06150.1 Diacylglycerol kinase family enzyme [Cellulomonas marina]
MTWGEGLAVVAVLLAGAALVLALMINARSRRVSASLERLATAPPLPAAPAPAVGGGPALPERQGPLVAFVANPTKPDVPGLRRAVRRACAEQYLPEPLWYDTTAEDPGVGQTRQAVQDGARLVVAVGGDGTVRAVAEGLLGTGVPMGLMPLGTGNLLARNLDIPLNDPMGAFDIALDGVDRAIDVGQLRVERWESQVRDDIAEAADDRPADTDEPRDHIFLVIAGLGFDAAMVADTDEQLKARVGWIAYFVGGVRHLHGRRIRAEVGLDDGDPQAVRLRSLLVGNCGRLPGGIMLLPDAELDDGVLDVASIDTRGGLVGWAQLLGEVVLQGVGLRNELPNKIGRIDHARARTVQVDVPEGEAVQVDGEVIGRVSRLEARVEPGALVVRVTPESALGRKTGAAVGASA